MPRQGDPQAYFPACLIKSSPDCSCPESSPTRSALTLTPARCEQIKMNILAVVSAWISLLPLYLHASCFSDLGNTLLSAFAH